MRAPVVLLNYFENLLIINLFQIFIDSNLSSNGCILFITPNVYYLSRSPILEPFFPTF